MNRADIARQCLRRAVLAASLLGLQPVHADPALGRLFFTPAERTAIDLALSGRAAPDSEVAIAPAGPVPSRVDGLMRRSLGPAVVWIDGRATPLAERRPARAGDPPLPYLDAEYVAVPSPEGGWLRLRPGAASGAAP